MGFKNQVNKIKTNSEYRTFISTLFSFTITLAFACYHAYLGIVNQYTWSICICIYYVLLTLVRGLIIFSEKRIKTKDEKEKLKRRKETFLFTSVLLFIINLALIAPIILLVLQRKDINFTLIPAIAMATYTTYKITISIINYKKSRRNESLITIKELRTINLIDALVSVLTLQNTLIMVTSETVDEKMFILSAVSSGIILLIIIFISVISVISYFKKTKENENRSC